MLSTVVYGPSIARSGTCRKDPPSTAERHPVSVIVSAGNLIITTWISILCMFATEATETQQVSTRDWGCLFPLSVTYVAGIDPLYILVRISNKGPRIRVNGDVCSHPFRESYLLLDWHQCDCLPPESFLQFSLLFPVFFPASLSATDLDVDTDFDSSPLLHRHTLWRSTEPSGRINTADEESRSRQTSLTEDSSLVQRVTRWYTFPFGLSRPKSPGLPQMIRPTISNSVSVLSFSIFPRRIPWNSTRTWICICWRWPMTPNFVSDIIQSRVPTLQIHPPNCFSLILIWDRMLHWVCLLSRSSDVLTPSSVDSLFTCLTQTGVLTDFSSCGPSARLSRSVKLHFFQASLTRSQRLNRSLQSHRLLVVLDTLTLCSSVVSYPLIHHSLLMIHDKVYRRYFSQR